MIIINLWKNRFIIYNSCQTRTYLWILNGYYVIVLHIKKKLCEYKLQFHKNTNRLLQTTLHYF
jgi:hypothetical protein